MIQIPSARTANMRSFNQRTKNLETAICNAITLGKDSCHLPKAETNSMDVSQLEQLGYETSVDSNSYVWVYWKRLYEEI